MESERQKPRGPWETMGKRFAVFLVKRAGAKGTERNDLSVKKATQMPVTFLLTNRPDIYELIFDLSPLKPARINWKIVNLSGPCLISTCNFLFFCPVQEEGRGRTFQLLTFLPTGSATREYLFRLIGNPVRHTDRKIKRKFFPSLTPPPTLQKL